MILALRNCCRTFFSMAVDCRMRASSDKHQDIISFEAGEKGTQESMRFLPRGEHKFMVSTEGAGKIRSLFILSIPEIILHEFLGNPAGDLGVPLLDFYKTYVMQNVNTLIAHVKLDEKNLRPFFQR